MLGEFGEKGRLYAGGTELLLAMKHDLLRYEHLVNHKTIPDLNKIELKNGSLMVGSTVTHRAIERSPSLRKICRYSRLWRPTSPTCECARERYSGGQLLFANLVTPIPRLCYSLSVPQPMSKAKPARRP